MTGITRLEPGKYRLDFQDSAATIRRIQAAMSLAIRVSGEDLAAGRLSRVYAETIDAFARRVYDGISAIERGEMLFSDEEIRAINAWLLELADYYQQKADEPNSPYSRQEPAKVREYAAKLAREILMGERPPYAD